ncbi:MAG: carbohydrate ABC transporter permease [Armatimonadetes bacterium]|nr:carbohydrate ABC transporter permease [Armatimonadota bacterium]
MSADISAYAKVARRRAAVAAAGRILVFVVLIGFSVMFLTPLYLMLSMAFKSSSELATTSAWAWPQKFTLENFNTVLTAPAMNFVLFGRNTLIIAVTNTVGVVLTSAMVAYAFARLRFRGRDRLFIIVLATMMLPGIVTMVPTYVLYAKLHWINTFLPLTVPGFLGGGAFNIFMLRQFFMSVPRELDEAAVLDGAGHWTVFSRIMLPLSTAALATVGVFTFSGAFRDFMGPLLYLNDPDMKTLEVGLQTYAGLRGERWDLLMAGSVITTVPLILLFFFGQKYFVKGLTLTGGK